MSEYQDLIEILSELKNRIEILEDENKEIKQELSELRQLKIGSSFQTKLTIALKERPSPSITFEEWIELLLNRIETKLDVVFQNDLLTGISSLFKDVIQSLDNPPIIAFHRRSNIFYYHDSEGNWTILENTEFDKLLKRIDYRFLLEFSRCWFQPNRQKIQDIDEYKDMYTAYHLKILGGENMSDEYRYKRIKHTFYNDIKEHL